jgi:hypothetical protein
MQLPPASLRVNAEIPDPTSTTSRWPEESNAICRGVVRPFAINCAWKPGATDGAGYLGDRELEQDVCAAE